MFNDTFNCLILYLLSGPSAVKCGLADPCPKNDFAFKIASGAANVVGPQICFDGKMYVFELRHLMFTNNEIHMPQFCHSAVLL